MSSSAHNELFDHYAQYRRNTPAGQFGTISTLSQPQRQHLPEGTTSYHHVEGRNSLSSFQENRLAISHSHPITRRETSAELLPPVYQRYEGTLINFVIPSPTPSTSLEFDEFKFEALGAIEASLEANKRYCYNFDQKQCLVQSSPEAVRKRAMLANICA